MKQTPERDIALAAVDLTTILPCPACNHPVEYPDEIWFNGTGPPPCDAVECGWCGARGPHGMGMQRGDFAGSIKNAIEMWNGMPRRAVSP